MEPSHKERLAQIHQQALSTLKSLGVDVDAQLEQGNDLIVTNAAEE